MPKLRLEHVVLGLAAALSISLAEPAIAADRGGDGNSRRCGGGSGTSASGSPTFCWPRFFFESTVLARPRFEALLGLKFPHWPIADVGRALSRVSC
jgi:hypothetical protein